MTRTLAVCRWIASAICWGNAGPVSYTHLALHEGAWTLDEVLGTLQDLFDRQYILTEDVVVEVRYRTVTRTDSEGNDYDVEVPYNYYICYVTLENFNLSHVPVYMMSEEQLSMYALYMSDVYKRQVVVRGRESRLHGEGRQYVNQFIKRKGA